MTGSHGPRRIADEARPIVVLGEFDGFHLGHRQLIDAALRVGERAGRRVIAVVLADEAADAVLTGIDERCWALLASGVASALVITSDPTRHADAGAQIVQHIARRLDPVATVIACLPDEPGIARYPALRGELALHGIEVIEAERWTDPDGRFITSARIRDALATGHIPRANDWLGRAYTLTGNVVHGSGLGHTIGFPTANLDLPANQLVPMNGVYAAHVDLETGERHRAAVNIGVRPTVEQHGAVLVEAHLLDFDEDIYETRISVAFRRWLRHEQRFESIDQLVAQLHRDVDRTRLTLRT